MALLETSRLGPGESEGVSSGVEWAKWYRLLLSLPEEHLEEDSDSEMARLSNWDCKPAVSTPVGAEWRRGVDIISFSSWASTTLWIIASISCGIAGDAGLAPRDVVGIWTVTGTVGDV